MSDLHVVVGASGGAGAAVVRALAADGERVRAVSRSGTAPAPGVEAARGDATDAAAMRAACAGAAVVYHCVNVPYAEWPAVLPPAMDGVLAGAEAAGAAVVYCDNLYMYGEVDGPITESTPLAATGAKGRLRIELADRLLEAHAAGRVRAAIGRGSDFFGPDAPNTLAGQLVFPAVAANRRAHWIGDLDQPHSLNFIDDFARGLITLGRDLAASGPAAGGGAGRAAGGVWHIPAGPAPTGRELIEVAFAAATLPPKVGLYRRWMIRLVGLFNGQMREALEVLHQFERPFILDGSRFTRAFGDPGLTPFPDAVARTLAWQREAPGASEAARTGGTR